MEKMIDFDTWIENFVPPKIEYYAIFDKETSTVLGIYPDHAAKEIVNKIPVDAEFADDVFNGKVSLSLCYVNEIEEKLEINRVKVIDNILHRVIDKRYSEDNSFDLIIRYISEDNLLEFEINENIKKRNIRLPDDTELSFIISSYNDPHKIYQVIKFNLRNLFNSTMTVSYIGTDKKFSIFTPRVFKKYLFEKL